MRFAIMALTLLCAACTTPDMIKTSATRNAVIFVNEMNWDAEGVSCSANDSDHDWDVTCTVSFGDQTIKAVECSYDRAFAPLGQVEGCKIFTFARGFQAEPD